MSRGSMTLSNPGTNHAAGCERGTVGAGPAVTPNPENITMIQKSSRSATAHPAVVSGEFPAFLTPEEASRFLGGVHPRTLTRWARQRYIPAYPIGEGRRRIWRFRRDDLDQWMLARRSGPAPFPADQDRRTLSAATDASGRRNIQ